MALTDTAIKRLRPSEKCTARRPDKHSDRHGLQLWVRHTGTKVFYSAYRYDGKQKQIQLGKYPLLSLKEAREENQTIKKLLLRNIDPKEHRQQLKYEQDSQNTFGVIAEAWHKEQNDQLCQGHT